MAGALRLSGGGIFGSTSVMNVSCATLTMLKSSQLSINSSRIDLVCSATDSSAAGATSALELSNGYGEVSALSVNIKGTASLNLTGNTISIFGGLGGVNLLAAGAPIVADGANQITLRTAGNTANSISLIAPNINLSLMTSTGSMSVNMLYSSTGSYHTVSFKHGTIDLNHSDSPIISLYNDDCDTLGEIGVNDYGIRLRNFRTVSTGNHTFFDIQNCRINMGLEDLTDYNEVIFATFGEKSFDITLSNILLDEAGDPALRVCGTLSQFMVDMPAYQQSMTLSNNGVLYLNYFTPSITTSTGNKIAYPGCGYTSTASYTVPSKSAIKLINYNYGASISNTLSGSTLTRHSSFTLSGGEHGAIYQIWGTEIRQSGELRVATTSSANTATYAMVTGEADSWGSQTLCVTVAVSAGAVYYLWGKNMTSLYYTKTTLSV